jgi:plastocyanin
MKGREMIHKRAATLIAVALACLAGGAARAQAPAKSRAARGPTAAEFEELKKRVDRQNELIMQLTQIEGAHYDYLVKLLQNSRPGGPPIVLPGKVPPPPPVGTASPDQPAPVVSEHEEPPVAAHPKVATIAGHVEVKGKAWGPTYVYVENIKEAPVERTVEIAQKDRAFVPNFLAVQRGTRVSFPNGDPFLHNVFSPSPTSPFDLGSYRQGEKPGVVRLFNSGAVEVLCNMHAKMRANILVLPNRHFAKVASDGSFHLENVPVGGRQVVAWTPDAKPRAESVALTPAGATVNFSLQVEPPPPPLDKTGMPRR